MKLQTYAVKDNLATIHPEGHGTLLRIARHYAQSGTHDGTHSSSREDISNGPLYLPLAVVPPRVLLKHAPWIEGFYKGPLLQKAREFAGPLVIASKRLDNYPWIRG